LNQPWLERAACWKRQEVSGMLIAHWNVASWALPAFALNPIIWTAGLMTASPRLKMIIIYLLLACLLARSYFCKKASKIIIEMICLLQVLSPVGGGDYWHLPG